MDNIGTNIKISGSKDLEWINITQGGKEKQTIADTDLKNLHPYIWGKKPSLSLSDF
jgi:hypothetical protein